MTPQALQTHVRELAVAFDVRLIESAALLPHEAVALPQLRVALCPPVTDETSYAVALHEIGHLVAPTGVIRHAVQGNRDNLLRIEEEAAWAWARHYALDWTPVMEAVARYAEGTYAAPPPRPAAPPVEAPRTQQVDWSKYR